MKKTRKLPITEDHYIGLAEASGAKPTIDVYGKVVRNATIEPASSGLIHPSGENEDLQLAQVVGYSDRGRSVALPRPQLVALPAPDGPAEGTGWDPKKYVVWKDLPKNWTTLHLQATARGLHSALTSASAVQAPAQPCLQLPAAVQLVRSCSNADPSLPLSTPLNQIFPSPTERNSFCQCVANGVPIDRSAIPCGATNTLQDVVDAITCK
jgi:hypothetical protein